MNRLTIAHGFLVAMIIGSVAVTEPLFLAVVTLALVTGFSIGMQFFAKFDS